jgi:hypothetical protein
LHLEIVLNLEPTDFLAQTRMMPSGTIRTNKKLHLSGASAPRGAEPCGKKVLVETCGQSPPRYNKNYYTLLFIPVKEKI